MQMITVSHGETMLTTPDAALALQVLAGLSASEKPAAAPSGIPAIGEYWPGEGGVNGGLFPGGDKPYYLIVPIGADAEKELSGVATAMSSMALIARMTDWQTLRSW